METNGTQEDQGEPVVSSKLKHMLDVSITYPDRDIYRVIRSQGIAMFPICSRAASALAALSLVIFTIFTIG
jgi:hypothetical protein